MKKKWFTVYLVLLAFAAVTATCGGDDLEDETQDVIEEQQEAADVAEENPQDTARVRREAQDVIQEQREAAQALRKEVREQGLDTMRPPRTTTRE